MNKKLIFPSFIFASISMIVTGVIGQEYDRSLLVKLPMFEGLSDAAIDTYFEVCLGCGLITFVITVVFYFVGSRSGSGL